MDTFTKLFDENKALLERIAQMLTKLIKSRRPTE